jgi:hypothetical protein
MLLSSKPQSLEDVCECIDYLCGPYACSSREKVSSEKVKYAAQKLFALSEEIAAEENRAKRDWGSSVESKTAVQQSVHQDAKPLEQNIRQPATKPASATKTEGKADALESSSRGSPRYAPKRWADSGSENDSARSGMAEEWRWAALVVAFTIPYYICVTYRDWYIDEGFAIYKNADARGETPIREVLKHDFWGTPLDPPEGYTTHKSFRPLMTLSFACEWLLTSALGLGGREMQTMRFLSCLVHSANAAVVFFLFRALRVPLGFSLLGASLFATHPVHIENIVYLVGRADVVATTFYVIATLAYLKATLGQHPKRPPYLTLILLTIASGLSKETGFTALFFLACAEVVLRLRWAHVAGLLVSFAVVGGLRTWYVGGTAADFGYVDTPIRYQDDWTTRTLSYLYQHAYYGKLLLLPWNQSWDYSFDCLPMLHSLSDVRMLLICAAYLAVASLGHLGLLWRRREPQLVLGVGLVVVPFIPATNLFFLVGTTVGERLLYPCTVGSALVLVVLLRRRRWGMPVLAALLLVYTVNSNLRMGVWSSKGKLFSTDAVHWGKSAKVLHQHAVEQQARGDLNTALINYVKSLTIFDDQAITDYCIARILLHLDRVPEALAYFDKILNGHGIGFHDGNDFLWMTDLGYALIAHNQDKEQLDQGIYYMKEGLNRFPHNCYGWNALGVAQIRLMKLQEALQSISIGLECDSSSASLWNNAAVAYAYGDMWNDARSALQNALDRNASRPAVQRNARVFTGEAPAGTPPELDLFLPMQNR